jgi:hypothetical protein
MNAPYRAHADPPVSLADRLRQLNDSLQRLALRLKDAIAGAIGKAVAEAVRDGVNGLLGGEDEAEQTRDDFYGGLRQGRHGWDDEEERHEDDPWYDGAEELPIPPRPARRVNSRWREAVRAAMQTALWWLRQQPCKRPILTTAVVALAAGSAAFVAGPTFAACVGVLASVVSLLLTADSARSAAELIGLT